TTKATSVTPTMGGNARQITFLIPSSVNIQNPTPYLVSISGVTSTGVAFASSNTASLTIIPAASLVSVVPISGQQGQSLAVTITGRFTSFRQGTTHASFRAGSAVGT